MKKVKRILALLLVFAMCFACTSTAFAAGRGSTDRGQSKPSSGGSSSSSSSSNGDVALVLVEDETTVEAGTELRASTYALTTAANADAGIALLADDTNTTTLKYFPVTLYDYDKETFNQALHKLEVDAALASKDGISSLTKWNGIYFGNGAGTDSYTYSTGDESSYTSTTVSYSSNNNYNTYINNGYYVDVNGTKYLVTGLSCTRSGSKGSYTYSWTITYAGGTATSSDSSITLYKASNTATVSLEFADHNKWTGDLDGNNGNRIYSGMAQDTLDANNNILFNYPDGGLFNLDTSVKTIYTNVGLPFVYDASTGYYNFDANEFGAYFHTDSTQGTSSTPASNTNLYYSTTPQSHNFSGQDQRTKGWFPYDDTTSVNTNTANYYFGMNASIPFTMTANGRMSPTDDNSDPIKFTFSGDDDVWVYIDGHLVLDIGGDRNGMNATLDFSTNTWEITEMTTLTGKPAGDVNGGALSGKIFNDDEGTGKINQTIETFAATDNHTLTIFYLERGGGSSNCQIKFNLPMKDTVSVTKRATQSISSDGTLSPLTAKEQATVDGIDFGFTLTKNGTPVANTNYILLDVNGNPLETRSTDANGHFTLRNGQTARFVGEIAADGAEYQVVEDAVEGIGFKLPTYTYSGTAAGSFTVSSTRYGEGSDIPATKENLTSAAVTAKGSTEAEDSLQFICENYFDANLPNPSSRPVDDQIVIDYGLPVIIDALANDVYRGETIELTDVTGAQYGTATIENGKITYQLTEQLTGVEVLTYTAKVTGSGNQGTETTTESESNTANIYIIPATSMYYEENFSGLVTFSDDWSDVGTAQTDPQEPGVVGTVGDSPYGSDKAYLNDSGDSNGSSKYVNTTNGAAQFSYTFTGTGTTFFARTTNNSGYMRVVIKDNADTTVYTAYRDTSYKDKEGTIGGDINVTGGILYNIPVFTYEADNPGTYTVTVTIAGGANAQNYGNEFWLDGIRVMSPLDSADANASMASSAYATDGEANMTVVTLRNKLLSYTSDEGGELTWSGDGFVLFTDTNGEIKTAQEYESNGPKEEVYLDDGQSVTFSLKNWDANTNRIYLGIKAPTGSGSVSINDNTLSINNATDCYYDISSYASITTNETGVQIATFRVKATSSLISLTNIKVTGNAKFTIVDQFDEEISTEEVAFVYGIDLYSDSDPIEPAEELETQISSDESEVTPDEEVPVEDVSDDEDTEESQEEEPMIKEEPEALLPEESAGDPENPEESVEPDVDPANVEA